MVLSERSASAVAANVVYLLTSVVIVVPKFASYRDIVFGKAIRDQECRTVEV